MSLVGLQGCSLGQTAETRSAINVKVDGSVRRELLAHLDHPVLGPRQPCPVTKANVSIVTPPAALRSGLNGDLRGLYGNGALWAILPAGRHTVTRD